MQKSSRGQILMRCTVQTLSLRRAWQALCSCQSHLGLSIVLTLTALFCPLSLGIIVRMRWRNCFVQPLLRVPSASMIIEVLSSRCKAAPIRWWKVGNTQCICVLTSFSVSFFPPKMYGLNTFWQKYLARSRFFRFFFWHEGKMGDNILGSLVCLHLPQFLLFFWQEVFFRTICMMCVFSTIIDCGLLLYIY